MAPPHRRAPTEVPDGKARILLAAAELAAEHGVPGVTISQICRRAGVKPPAIYYHFGSKEGLLGVLLETVADAWLEQLEAAQPHDGDLAARLRAAVDGWQAMIEDPGHPIPLLLSAQLGGAETAPELRTALDRVHRSARAVIARGIRAAAGELSGLPELADQVHGLVLAAALAFQLDGDRVGLRARLVGVGRLVEGAVHGASPKSRRRSASSGPRPPKGGTTS